MFDKPIVVAAIDCVTNDKMDSSMLGKYILKFFMLNFEWVYLKYQVLEGKGYTLLCYCLLGSYHVSRNMDLQGDTGYI